LNRLTTYVLSTRIIASIALNDALILPNRGIWPDRIFGNARGPSRLHSASFCEPAFLIFSRVVLWFNKYELYYVVLFIWKHHIVLLH
jgi:hypothetical protein